MPEKTLFQIGSRSAIIGGILALVVNLLHPRALPGAHPEAYLEEVAGYTIWVPDHLGIFFAIVLVVGGLLAISRSITAGAGAVWARLGRATAVVGVALVGVFAAIDGIAMKQIVDAWASAQAGEKEIAFRVAMAFFAVNAGVFSVVIMEYFGLNFVLYGLAVLGSTVYPRWLGWVALLAGIGAFAVGLIQGLSGPTPATFGLFTAFAIPLTLWVIAMGVLLGRKASGAV